MSNPKKFVRNSLLALALLTLGTPVVFAIGEVVTSPQQSESFDDWGLAGLLGLLGLLGRLRR